eukprot:TRINITY_DN102943_c0_g1_i1.p1 TRINITY_DN102943_c0_g1~~TRINITY_DN102943_c0_g1_i1.p1  ORF type:complete len:315 (-),score=57.43 TRINITY_DN102943_c0_g1_i1:71-892(-)
MAEQGGRIASDQKAIQEHFNQLPFGQHFVADGTECQGEGHYKDCTTNGPTRIYGALAEGLLDEDVFQSAVGIAGQIVKDHNLRDGNGRTSLYSLYFHLANKGFKLTLEAKYLHAAFLSEDERNVVPFRQTTQLIRCFSEPVNDTNKLMEHLMCIRRDLAALEDKRKDLRNRWSSLQSSTQSQDGFLASEAEIIVWYMPKGDAELAFWKRMHCYGWPQVLDDAVEAPPGSQDDGYDERFSQEYREMQEKLDKYEDAKTMFLDGNVLEKLKEEPR